MCKAMAVISTISANVSLFIIAILTMYRARGILGTSNFRFRTIIITAFIGWIMHILLAIIPVSGLMMSDIPDSCLLYSLSSHALNGWKYSFFGLTLVNLFPLCGIVVAYAKIVHKVVSIQNNPLLSGAQVSGKKKSSSLPLNALLLVGSNLLVWIPVMILSLLATSNLVDIPSDLSR